MCVWEGVCDFIDTLLMTLEKMMSVQSPHLEHSVNTKIYIFLFISDEQLLGFLSNIQHRSISLISCKMITAF